VRLLGGSGRAEMHVGGVAVSALADLVRTPYYVYDGDAVIAKVREVRAALGPETDLYFSIKANPSLGICQLMAREGVGAELASIGELHLARKAGFPARKAIFAGPGKTREELEQAVSWGIESVNVESAGEIARLAAIAAGLDRPVRACLRINPREQVKGAQMRMGGGHTQFGIDEELVPEVIERYREHTHLRLVGLHVYVGSQIADVSALIAHCHRVVDLALDVAERLGRPLEAIDLGGGFAVPYFEGSPEFDLSAFAASYRDVVARCRRSPHLARARLIIELGRYLVAESGLYVARVVDVKVSRGVTYVVADGGMNHHITATGNFGQVFRKPYPVAVLNRLNEACDTPVSFVGPCCTPLDTIGQGIPAPKVEVGDLLGIFYSGAYGYSASSLGFLSHPTPAEVMVLGGRAHVLRAPGRPDGILDGQRGIEPG
jgi:diaminopimelate decarboxylase